MVHPIVTDEDRSRTRQGGAERANRGFTELATAAQATRRAEAVSRRRRFAWAATVATCLAAPLYFIGGYFYSHPLLTADALKIYYTSEQELLTLSVFFVLCFFWAQFLYWWHALRFDLLAIAGTLAFATFALTVAEICGIRAIENYFYPRPVIVLMHDLLLCERETFRWSDIEAMSFGKGLKGDDFNARLVLRDGTHALCDLDHANEPSRAVYQQIRAVWSNRRR